MEEKLGKIDHHIFEQFIALHCGKQRSEVLVKAAFGVDVSVVALGNGLAMALTSDPLSLIPSLGMEESAWLSVHLMANDMATTGYAPMYGQFVLNLPSWLSRGDFENYWRYIHQFSKDIGLAITGGHTGFIEGQNSTLAGGGTFITVAPEKQILVSKNARPGDAILITKSCAISSSAILAMSFPKTVQNKLGTEVYHKACESFYQTSSLQDALIAVKGHNGRVLAMHDVTEGGVLGAVYEMASASGNGARIHYEKLPVGQVQDQVCRLFNLNPASCIGAGAMVIATPEYQTGEIIQDLKNEGIECTHIGNFTEASAGIQLLKDGQPETLVYQEEDPYWAAFFKALKEGLQ
ncbi:MAG: AIR synthase family protein [Cyclobacteriaceae bacterium]|nr:AIR synthase family protein [Cyclobacteriaceae bacterium]